MEKSPASSEDLRGKYQVSRPHRALTAATQTGIKTDLIHLFRKIIMVSWLLKSLYTTYQYLNGKNLNIFSVPSIQLLLRYYNYRERFSKILFTSIEVLRY